MKKLLNIILCGVLLSVLEYVILFVLSQLWNVIEYSVPITKISGAILEANEVSAVRFIFYFAFWVLAIYCLYDKVNIKSSVLKLALINCAVYVVLSIIMTLFFPFASEYFKESFFYFLVTATLISPFLLSIIPNAQKLIKCI